MAEPADPTRLLRAVPRTRRAATLADVVEFGSARDRAVFVPVLCELAALEALTAPRQAPAFARACLHVWPWLPDDYQRLMRATDLDWLAVATGVLESSPPSRRARIPSAAREMPDLIALLPRMLTDPDPAVVRAGGEGLRELAAAAIEAHDRARSERIASALVASLATFEHHRQRSVIEAVWRLLESPAWAAGLGQPGQALLDWLRTSKDSSRSAARSVLRTASHPWLRARAVAWLAEPAAQTAALDRLARTETAADHEAVLDRLHLLTRPVRAQVVGLLSQSVKPVNVGQSVARRVVAGGAIPVTAQIEELSPDAAEGLPGWLAFLGLSPADRAMACESLLLKGSPRARHSMARSLDDAHARDLLADADPLVARHAAYRWSLAGVGAGAESSAAAAPRLRQARRFMRSQSPVVRAVATDQAARFDPLLWSQPAARILARRLLAANPESLISLIREALAGEDQPRRLAAAMAAATLKLGGPLREPLESILRARAKHDPVASAAIRALLRAEQSAPEQGATVLHLAMDHPDTRVRANAIEELSRSPRATHVDDDAPFEGLLGDRAHRLRTAAVRAALAEPKLASAGRSALLAMLSDDLAMHRVSGAWLAWRARVTDSAARLRDLALHDSDGAVRARAEWSLRRLASGGRAPV